MTKFKYSQNTPERFQSHVKHVHARNKSNFNRFEPSQPHRVYLSQVISVRITIQMAREKKVKQQFESIVWLFHVCDLSANKLDCGHSLPPGHNIVKGPFSQLL